MLKIREQQSQSATAIDSVTRRRRLLGIRLGKIVIVLSVLFLIRDLRAGIPTFAKLGEGVIALISIGGIVQMIARVQKSLR